MNISCATVEAITGLPTSYFSKIAAARPSKDLTARTMQEVLDALGLRIAVVVLVEDEAKATRMRPRWVQRQRAPTTPRQTEPSADQGSFKFVE